LGTSFLFPVFPIVQTANAGDPAYDRAFSNTGRLKMKRATVRQGFIAAGIMNIGGVLLFSRGLSNQVMLQVDPVVMGLFGLVMIMVWGLAYLAVADRYDQVPWLVGVFCLEKFIYASVWALWMAAHLDTLGTIYDQDLFAGIFYTIYGINDLVFALFFAWVFWTMRNNEVITVKTNNEI